MEEDCTTREVDKDMLGFWGMMGSLKGNFGTLDTWFLRQLSKTVEVVSMAMWELGPLCSTREFVGLCFATA